jgi:hypothetical protein
MREDSVNVLAQVVIGNLVTLVVSISITLVSVGAKWGKLDSDVQALRTQIAEIRGMFALKLKE